MYRRNYRLGCVHSAPGRAARPTPPTRTRSPSWACGWLGCDRSSTISSSPSCGSWPTGADITRFPTKGHFASHTGTAPVEASSGEVVRHRLSRGGDRQLNYALHMVAICQIAQDSRGRAYYRRKVAEGKSGKEALRCLKRRISDAVFQKLRSDLRAVSTAAA